MTETLTNRQINIMQTLVSMLESKEPIKITTAELAKRCEITEAAIYKHFPSKRKIFEGLVDFCEENIFPRIYFSLKSYFLQLVDLVKIDILMLVN